MMRKIVLILMVLLFCSVGVVQANANKNKNNVLVEEVAVVRPKIVFMWNNQYGNLKANQKVQKFIAELFERKFPKSKYNIIEDPQFKQAAFVLAEDKHDKSGWANMRTLTREEIARIANSLGYDYAIVFDFLLVGFDGSSYSSAGIAGSHSTEISVDLQAKIVDAKTGEYIYRQDVIGTGVSQGGYIWGFGSSGSPKNAIADGVRKSIETVFTELTLGEKFVPKQNKDED